MVSSSQNGKAAQKTADVAAGLRGGRGRKCFAGRTACHAAARRAGRLIAAATGKNKESQGRAGATLVVAPGGHKGRPYVPVLVPGSVGPGAGFSGFSALALRPLLSSASRRALRASFSSRASRAISLTASNSSR